MQERSSRYRCALAAAVCLLVARHGLTASQSCRSDLLEALAAGRPSAQARQALEQCASSNPSDPSLVLLVGRCYLAQRDAAKAVTWIEEASRLEPMRSEDELWLGRAYGLAALHANVLHQPGLARKVARAFERAVELDPGNLEARQSLVEYDLLAPSFLGGSPSKAAAQAEEIRSRDPLKGHRAFGFIAEHEKHFDEAAREYDQAIADFPDAADPVYWQVELAVRRKDYAAAFRGLESLAGGAHPKPEALYRIGELAAESGKGFPRGEESLKLYLHHKPEGDEPSLALAHLRLGAIYVRQKRGDEARREFEAALDLDPLLTEARQALAKLK